ncbi:M50 family metallopeptidase [Parvularcula sp. LCG005]|uniref:M50 family metallopeptidase n=1 Tax=Parvularcula sp. LCG005 TaxID=3078805 RepID=UPI0029434A19|nr:M50 family metallopeptidase [Parvularcula sp. LCG005]WOI52758.1 M50 family metallopeptidase [Parvularcula sp. LCG005]
MDFLVPVIISVASFSVLLPLIVFVHEYGHFKTARLCGVKVDTFSIGFGPTLTQWIDRRGTAWKIAAVPLGGYVKFFGDANAASAGADAGEEKQSGTQFKSEKAKLESLLTPEEKRVCFHFKPVWQRMLIVAAGPFANFILAVVIFAALYSTIGERYLQPVIQEVVADSPAAEAGMMPRDRIVRIENHRVKSFNDVQMRVRLSAESPLDIVVERNGATVPLVLTPERTEMTDGFGNTVSAGRAGISFSADDPVFIRYNPITATWRGVQQVGSVLDTTVVYLGRLVTGREDPRQLGGPVKIAQYAGQAVSSGFDAEVEAPLTARVLTSLTNFIQLAALMSVSIGFLNLLPVPVLDGGHLVYYGYEAVAGRPLSDRVQGIGFRIGLALVGSLMIFVVVNDVVQLF